ncbi:MAG TPA: glycosyltransferase family 2 protein [Marmoricola sp.]|nr:glycosyltransferase family 2 protein [Marmoricola sp.]
MHTDELVTVVIPAANEAAYIGACVESVRGQTYDRLQILVVDGASTDATAELIRTSMQCDPRIELIHNPRRNIPSSLNLALEKARGRWLVRVDAHSTVGPDYVGLAVERLREGRWGGVGGRKDAVGRTPAGRAIAVAMSSRLGVGNSRYHFGTAQQEVDHVGFGAYPTEVVRNAGGWDERLFANEDFEFDYRLRKAGAKLLLDPRLVVSWECRQSVADLFRQYYRYGQGKADVLQLHPTSLGPRHVAPPALILYAALSVVVGARRPRRAVAMLGPYALGVAVESVRCAHRLDSSGERARLPAAFVAMHVGWGLGFWRGLLGRQRR